jgi:hypothetical protein
MPHSTLYRKIMAKWSRSTPSLPSRETSSTRLCRPRKSWYSRRHPKLSVLTLLNPLVNRERLIRISKTRSTLTNKLISNFLSKQKRKRNLNHPLILILRLLMNRRMRPWLLSLNHQHPLLFHLSLQTTESTQSLQLPMWRDRKLRVF